MSENKSPHKDTANKSLEDVLQANCGKLDHDLTQAKRGDVLVRDVYNHGQCCGVVTITKVVPFNSDCKLLLSNGDTCLASSGKSTVSTITWYRVPKENELEKHERQALVGRLAFFDWETTNIHVLRKLVAMLDDLVERQEQRYAIQLQSKMQRETLLKANTDLVASGKVSGRWLTLGDAYLHNPNASLDKPNINSKSSVSSTAKKANRKKSWKKKLKKLKL